MARINTIETGLYRIPLSVTLSDSTHGEIKAFELITARIRDSDGAEGVGYTYTVGRNGGAVADILRREVPELMVGGGLLRRQMTMIVDDRHLLGIIMVQLLRRLAAQ